MTEARSGIRIGLCGGTFDPFHRGHVEPVRAVFEHLEWTTVIYIPAAVQPFKTGQETSSPFHRHTMTVLGTIEDPRLEVSLVELERGSVSYTVDTVRYFRNRYPESTLDWIIGDDNVEKLTEWKALDEILDLANFVVLSRLGPPARLAPELRERVCDVHERAKAGSIVFAENEALAVSSTRIRELLKTTGSAGDLLQPVVAEYVNRSRLYTTTENE